MTARAMLLLLPALALGAADDIERARGERDEEHAKARAALDATIAKADEKAVKALEAAAVAAQRRGDLADAARAWKEVLRFDPRHAQATQFFTASGSLEPVLAEVAQRRPIPLAPAVPTTMPAGAIAVSVEALASADLGRQRAGTVIMVQYLDGIWSMRYGPAANPDATDAPAHLRLAIVDLTSGTPQVLAAVPGGTAEKPFAYTLAADVGRVGLAMVGGNRPRRFDNGTAAAGSNGRVRYKVGIIRP